MNSYIDFNSAYAKNYGWKSNPFSFKIIPELFVGYQKELSIIFNGVNDGSRFSLVLGQSGTGKTTFMKHVQRNVSEKNKILYLPKAPTDPKDLVEILTNNLGLNFENFGKEINLYNIGDLLNKEIRDYKIILFIDECQEAPKETFEWLRSLSDQIDNISIVLSGLPEFESILRTDIQSLLNRVNIRVEMGNLSKLEVLDLVKKRIEFVGGMDIHPFTHEALEIIYDKTAGYPREVLRTCEEVAQKAVMKNILIIDADFVLEQEIFKAVEYASIEELSGRQKAIIESIASCKSLTPSEVVTKIDCNEYKTKDNAVRSVNNILKRMVDEGKLVRKKKEKAFAYELAPRMQSIFKN